MTIMVRNKEDDTIEKTVYENVDEVIDTFDENGNYCHQIIMKDGSTATYPAIEWAFYKKSWTKMF